MTDEIKTLTTGNYLYQANHQRNLFLYNSYVGGQSYKDANYLTRYQLETDDEYKARITATPLDNQCHSVVSVYNSFLFRECPERNYGSIANLTELQEFLDDADFEGRSFDHFMKEVSTWNQVFGHCYVLMSKPDVGAITRADEIAQGVRPYVSILTPLVVLDWRYQRSANGRYSLSYIRYVEDINGSIQTIKEWSNDVIVTTVVDTNHNVIHNTTTEVNGLGLVPIVTSYNKRSIVRGLGVSAINDIADMQRFIYNATSEVDQSIRLDSHPSLVKTAETLAGVGAGAIIQLPENLDPGLKPYVLDFAGANIDNIYTSINNSIDAIEKMANIGSVRGNVAKTMSGVAMETEFQLLNANLSEKADNLELTEEQIWKLFCLYQSQTYDMEIDYPGSFNIRDTSREIEELRIASSTNPADPRVKAGIDAKILDWLSLDEDELAAIEDSSIMNPDEAVTEPGELPE